MENETMIAQNREIAIFMGLPIQKDQPLFSGGFETVDIFYNYHQDWNMLLGVFERIGELKAQPEGAGITVLTIVQLLQGGWRCHINYRKKYNGIESQHKSIDNSRVIMREAVYLSIAKFCLWYNTTITSK